MFNYLGFRGRVCLFVVSLLICSTSGVLRVDAQAVTAAILGTVSDPTGAAIPGTAIQVTNVATGITQTVTSDEQGRYRIPDLGLGEYDVEASKPGFQTVVRKSIMLNVGSQAV